MGVISYLAAIMNDPASPADNKAVSQTQVAKALMNLLYIAIVAVAIFLAVRDMSMLTHTTTKVWLFLLAVTVPELYVILHGISSSSMGIGFFSGSPVQGSASVKDLLKGLKTPSSFTTPSSDLTTPSSDLSSLVGR